MKMKIDLLTITISKEAHDALRSIANNGLDTSTSVRRPDGRVDIKIDVETYTRLREIGLRGETPSDTIVRAVAAMRGKRH